MNTCYRDGACEALARLRPFDVATMGTGAAPRSIKVGEATCADCGMTWTASAWLDSCGLRLVA